MRMPKIPTHVLPWLLSQCNFGNEKKNIIKGFQNNKYLRKSGFTFNKSSALVVINENISDTFRIATS